MLYSKIYLCATLRTFVEDLIGVFSCDFFVEPEWKLGNVLQDDIADLLNSELQSRFANRKAQLPPVCRSCPWLSKCYGGCPKDRIRDPKDEGLNHFCAAYKMFFKHADPHYRHMAKVWKQKNAMFIKKK